jgi:hypothetical protein
MLWAPGKEVDGGGGDHPMPTLAATTSNRDPYPMYRDGAPWGGCTMFKIARFRKTIEARQGRKFSFSLVDN